MLNSNMLYIWIFHMNFFMLDMMRLMLMLILVLNFLILFNSLVFKPLSKIINTLLFILYCLFSFPIICFSIPIKAIEFSTIKESFIHHFYAFFGMYCTMKFNFYYTIWIFFEKMNLVNRAYSRFNFLS
jgi:hypothetical protein